MKWSDEYATGIDAIDVQHRHLFRLTDDFRAALDEGRGELVYGELLVSLDLYVRTHFGMEEACMARFVCPVAKVNAEAHKRFITFLGRFSQQFATRGFIRDDARSLVDTLDLWLVSHITRVDVRLRELAQPS